MKLRCIIPDTGTKDLLKKLWQNDLHALPYSHPDWLDVVARNKWKVLIPENNAWYLPLVFRVPFYIIPPPFTPQSGPVGDHSLQTFEMLYNWLRKNILLGFTGLENPTNLHLQNFGTGITHHLLNKSEIALSTNHQRNLKKAIKNQIETKVITANEHLDFFNKYFDQRNDNIPKKYIETIPNIFKLNSNDHYWIHEGAFLHNKLLASVSWLVSKNTHYYLLASANEEGKNVGAAFLLVHNHFTTLPENILKIDFEGSRAAGVARFYKGFGANQVVYPVFYSDIYQTIAAWLPV